MTVNRWQAKRLKSGWIKSHVAHWIQGDTAMVSVVFSWDLPKAREVARYYQSRGFDVQAGGPAVTMQPEALADVATVDPQAQVHALQHHNPRATFTSRGCIRSCPFCAVPRLEGNLVELPDEAWEPKPLICDNNLLACSMAHFDHVIDRLQAANVKGVDFNQGLDPRLLTPYHARRVAELDLSRVRLAWDDVGQEVRFIKAWETLHKAHIPKRTIGVYCLIGFDDTPEDALYRLKTVADLGSLPYPMRYQPVTAKTRNEYVGPGWTHEALTKMCKYWGDLRNRAVPFTEWSLARTNGRKRIPKSQLRMGFGL